MKKRDPRDDAPIGLPIRVTITEEGKSRTIDYAGHRPLTIGRADENDIVLLTPRASRRHAEIIGEGGRFTLVDLGSGNGTEVRGERIDRIPLTRGLKFHIGDCEIRFGDPSAAMERKPGVRAAPSRAASQKIETSTPQIAAAPLRPSRPESTGEESSAPRPTAAAAPIRRRRTIRRVSPAQVATAAVVAIVAIAGIVWAVDEIMSDGSGAGLIDIGGRRAAVERESRNVAPTNPTGGISTPEGASADSLEPVREFHPPRAEGDDNLFNPIDDESTVPVRELRAPVGDDWIVPDTEGGPEREDTADATPVPAAANSDVPSDGETEQPVVTVETQKPLLRIIPDAWPPGARTIGYEFNQKNHSAPPDFIERKGPGVPERNSAHRGRHYRVIGVEIRPDGLPVGAQVRLRSRQVRRGEKIPLTLTGARRGERVRRYFALLEPEDHRVVFELLDSDGSLLATAEEVLPEGGHTTPLAAEAIAIERERAREEWEREQLATRNVTVSVFDDLGRPVPEARVLLLVEGGGLATFEGVTDEAGRFTRAVVPGSYTVFVHAEVPEPIDPNAPTIVVRLPRFLSLSGRIGAEENSLRLVPDRSVLVRILDEGETTLPIERIWVTPAPIAEAYRYEAVAQQIGVRGRLESSRPARGELRLLLGKLPVQLGLLGRTDDGEPVLISEMVTPERSEIEWGFSRERFAVVEFDPAKAAGGATSVTGELCAASRYRERFRFKTEGPWRAYVMPGTYRIELAATLAGGDRADFIPYSVDLPSGAHHQLAPRAPWSLTLYQKRKDRQQQFWLAVADAGGRLLERAPGEPGRLEGFDGTVTKLDRELQSLRFQEVERLLDLDLGKLRYETRIPYGSESIVGIATLEQLQVFNDAGSSARAPGVFERRIRALLPEVKKTIDGSLASLGLPDGMRRLHMEFDIFLPPGIGGTGGGGVITLDSAVLHRYACAGDLLPGAYRHEYGHNLGFGHDPYMMLAEGGSATDETLFGPIAYRLLHAATYQRTIDHLIEDRGELGFDWRPNAAVFPALRALFGPDVHHRMIDERRASEQTLTLHNLSSIERIAALYSLALDRNVAWIFRAHGWPVFDDRVDLGGKSVLFAKSHPRQLNYAFVPGTEIRSWWVLDIDGGGDPLIWRRINWPTAEIDLAIDGEPIASARRWLLFRSIAVPEETEARILVASDVQLEVRVNGQAIGRLDASPQQFQPAHDELMLNQKRPFPVIFPKGESFIEVAVNQPPGSRGFVLALATPEGKPLHLGLIDEPPPGEDVSSGKPLKFTTKPVLSGSFEAGWQPGWIEGATEPRGSLRFEVAEKSPAIGEKSLRVEVLRAGSGAIIQRIFLPPGKSYRLQAAMRTEDFAGEAFVGLFTGELGGWLGRTEPLRKPNTPWKPYTFRWSPGPSRVVYVACFVKGTRGEVWFDGIQLEAE